tara:strand:+ start:303 stop:836 length:534 start_codon:yes stop_codon:yes gene_type:complete
MRIVGVYCIDVHTKKIKSKTNLGFISIFKRPLARIALDDFVLFAGSSIGEHERKVFEHDHGVAACYRQGNVCCIIVTDLSYPTRVTFELLQRLFENSSEESMQYILDQCNDPGSVDSLYKVQKQLDDTLVIMHENVSKILERGHHIDELVDKTEHLSETSKRFYKVARDHNRCCRIS